MEFSIGQVIYSKAGRDKGRPFIVLKIESYFLYLSDGSLRKVRKPKKKKMMHVQPTKAISKEVAELVNSGGNLKDSDVRKALAGFLSARKKDNLV